MCLGNRAQASIEFLNQQYVGLYVNAKTCADKYPSNGVKPEQKEVLYGTSLYEFYRSRKNSSTSDRIIFSKAPDLHFVCNHEVIIYLNVEKGTYINNAKEERLDGAKLAFRFKFKSHNVEDIKDNYIGSRAYKAVFFILDIEENGIDLVSSLSKIPGVDTSDNKTDSKVEALKDYFVDYFALLKKAGHHVLLSLPDFDDLDSTSASIDYSVIYQTDTASEFTYIFDMSVEGINNYLKSLWLQAVSLIDKSPEILDNHDRSKEYLLSRYKDSYKPYGENIDLTFTFGPLKVAALCKIEAIIYINIGAVDYEFSSRNKSKQKLTFRNWKIAFIVDIRQAEGGVVEFDVTKARFCEHLSSYNSNVDNINVTEYWNKVVEYIRITYLQLIAWANFHRLDPHYIHEHGYGNPTPDPGDVDDGFKDGLDPAEDSGLTIVDWSSLEKIRIASGNTTPYDCITAVTQYSINELFKFNWEAASKSPPGTDANTIQLSCLSKYSLIKDDATYFEASFQAPMLQLIIDDVESIPIGTGQVILNIRLKRGYLKILGPNKTLVKSDEKHDFENWRVAFTIGLKLVPGRDNNKDLVLDFTTAQFNQARSSLRGLFDGEHYELMINKREALITYLSDYYFPTFIKAGHHVLYTVSLGGLKANANQIEASVGLTSLAFQIYPFTFQDSSVSGKLVYRDTLVGQERSISARNSILLLGMIGNHVLPKQTFDYRRNVGLNWIVASGGNIPLGSIEFSRESFLNSRLLKPLAIINRNTTVVPSFSGVSGNGEWVLKLTTWGEHEIRKNESTDWKPRPSTDGNLTFVWSNTDCWRYEHKSFDGTDDVYTVECITENIMTIPIGQGSNSLNILVKGNATVNLLYIDTKTITKWTETLTIAWVTAIVFSPDNSHGGLSVTTSPENVAPEFSISPPKPTDQGTDSSTAFSRQTSQRISEQLKGQFPKIVELKSIIDGLNSSLEVISSQFCDKFSQHVITSPAFNQNGDFLVEIRQEDEQKRFPPIIHAPAITAPPFRIVNRNPQISHANTTRPIQIPPTIGPVSVTLPIPNRPTVGPIEVYNTGTYTESGSVEVRNVTITHGSNQTGKTNGQAVNVKGSTSTGTPPVVPVKPTITAKVQKA